MQEHSSSCNRVRCSDEVMGDNSVTQSSANASAASVLQPGGGRASLWSISLHTSSFITPNTYPRLHVLHYIGTAAYQDSAALGLAKNRLSSHPSSPSYASSAPSDAPCPPQRDREHARAAPGSFPHARGCAPRTGSWNEGSTVPDPDSEARTAIPGSGTEGSARGSIASSQLTAGEGPGRCRSRVSGRMEMTDTGDRIGSDQRRWPWVGPMAWKGGHPEAKWGVRFGAC